MKIRKSGVDSGIDGVGVGEEVDVGSIVDDGVRVGLSIVEGVGVGVGVGFEVAIGVGVIAGVGVAVGVGVWVEAGDGEGEGVGVGTLKGWVLTRTSS